MAVDQKDYVELEMLNQRLTELQQSLDYSNQQIEHSSVALAMIKSLSNVKVGQELLVPIGGGVFITVNASDVKSVKLAVGAGVVVEKNIDDALTRVINQSKQIQEFYSQTSDVYDQVVSKTVKLQEKIESDMRSD